MLTSYSASRASVNSGDVILVRGSTASPSVYVRSALAWVRGGRVLLLEALDTTGATISVASDALKGLQCDLIHTNIVWTASVEHRALGEVGRGKSKLNSLLGSLGLKSTQGVDISSLYVAEVLRRAGLHLSLRGITSQHLADDLLGLGKEIQRLIFDCQPPGESGSAAHIKFLDTKGNPMSALSLPRDGQAAITLSFTDRVGNTVAGPSDLQAASSDPSIATVTLTGTLLTVTPVGDGSATIKVTSAADSLEGDLAVTVVDGTPVAVVFGDPVITPLPAPTPAAPAEAAAPAESAPAAEAAPAADPAAPAA